MYNVKIVKATLSGEVREIRSNLKDGFFGSRDLFDVAVPTGGLGWGVFDLNHSDIGLWLVNKNVELSEKLDWSLEMHGKYAGVIDSLFRNKKINDKAFRHPATYLDADEFYWYRKLFPAFYGFPIESGIYVPFIGSVGEKSGFSKTQLVKDAEYLAEYFSLNLEKPSYGCSEDTAKRERRIKKRMIYFLRFWLLLKNNIYVVDPADIISEMQKYDVYASEIYYLNNNVELIKKQASQLMKDCFSRLQTDLSELDRQKAYLRRHYFKILMKNRWDFVLDKSGMKEMRPEISKRWIDSHEYIEAWVAMLGSILDQEKWIAPEWRKVKVGGDTAFHHKFTVFMDKLLPFLGQLY